MSSMVTTVVAVAADCGGAQVRRRSGSGYTRAHEPLRPLPQSFFARAALEVARDLIGCTFLFGGAGGRIVETEAYRQDDPCCHGYSGKTERNAVLFGPPGHLYVYFTYGMHFCANVASEEEGVAAGVLLRALEPERGVEGMVARRGVLEPRLLASGPARLAQALGIGRAQNGLPVWEPPLADPSSRPRRARASRRDDGAHRPSRRRPEALALRRRRQPLPLATPLTHAHPARWVR